MWPLQISQASMASSYNLLKTRTLVAVVEFLSGDGESVSPASELPIEESGEVPRHSLICRKYQMISGLRTWDDYLEDWSTLKVMI